jgi:hypothetical protein
MKLVTGCSCGAVLTEKNFVPPVGKAEKFGLPNGTLGNTQATFIKVKCAACGLEYVAEIKPGKHGGTIAIGRIMDCITPPKPVEITPPVLTPAKSAKAASIKQDGYINMPEA